MANYSTADKTIKLPFPSKKYNLYKVACGEDKESNLTEAQINKIYKLMVNDFLNGGISVDDISSICNSLFDRTVKVAGSGSKLFDAINAGSELGFYVRNPKLSTQFNSFLKGVLEYGESIA